MFPPRSSILLATLLYATQASVASLIDHPRRSGHLQKRNSTSGLVFQNGDYNINITLGGTSYSVAIDTGRWATNSFIYPRRSAHSHTLFTRSPALTFGSRVPYLTLPPRALLPLSNMPSVRIQVCTLDSLARISSSTFPRPSRDGRVGDPWLHSSESGI